jgi:protein O-mannosyl-transferase
VYLKLAFLPDLFSYNPFHEQIKAFTFSTMPVIGWVALLALPALMIFAIRIRIKHPVISFAILWFFAAHLLESTVIGLELYFEHRNYVALFGPCFALGYGLLRCAVRYQKLMVAGAVAYLLLIATITGYVTSIWGTPLRAAEVWFDKEFGSARAAEHLALSYLEQNRLMEAYFVMQAQIKACPDCLGSRVQFMIIACAVNDPTSVAENLAAIKAMAPTQRMIGSAPSALASLKRQIEQNNCPLISLQEVKQLNELLLKYQSVEINASKRFELLLNLHQLAEFEQNKAVSLQYLQQAFSIRQDLMLGEVIFNNLLDLPTLTEAKTLLEQQLCHKAPVNPFLRLQHQQKCQELSERLNAKSQSLP